MDKYDTVMQELSILDKMSGTEQRLPMYQLEAI